MCIFPQGIAVRLPHHDGWLVLSVAEGPLVGATRILDHLGMRSLEIHVEFETVFDKYHATIIIIIAASGVNLKDRWARSNQSL